MKNLYRFSRRLDYSKKSIKKALCNEELHTKSTDFHKQRGKCSKLEVTDYEEFLEANNYDDIYDTKKF